MKNTLKQGPNAGPGSPFHELMLCLEAILRELRSRRIKISERRKREIT